ncbi:MAG: transposase [Deltaproteobacteria bacterium]|nr:transposase [Deltaproteobacteria bacterium]
MAASIPRDRDGGFEPALVEKHQRRLEGFDERVLALYAREHRVGLLRTPAHVRPAQLQDPQNRLS